MQFPENELALRLPTPTLAGYLLVAAVHGRHDSSFGIREVVGVDRLRHLDLRLAYTEAWQWLKREGLLLPNTDPNLISGPPEHVVLSRAARAMTGLEDFEAFRRARLPREMIHAAIRFRVETDFETRAFDAAVLKAFRQIEINARATARLPNSVHGVEVLKQAFHSETGQLTDSSLPSAERESMKLLFMGAHGLYRNSTGHRDVELGAEECIELLIMASHLLRIIDERGRALGDEPSAVGEDGP